MENEKNNLQATANDSGEKTPTRRVVCVSREAYARIGGAGIRKLCVHGDMVIIRIENEDGSVSVDDPMIEA